MAPDDIIAFTSSIYANGISNACSGFLSQDVVEPFEHEFDIACETGSTYRNKRSDCAVQRCLWLDLGESDGGVLRLSKVEEHFSGTELALKRELQVGT
ncbi:hypothetical protein [Oligoflexus tunisiensis]|uniref:hypothetical protein n=1 Tax=Oligoflexus tunisiensis TaxID=708132 RepID=UPI001C406D0E|nr:hypothetical protein [Oligoflexus tunisiensis]